jgi:hypothetical protein
VAISSDPAAQLKSSAKAAELYGKNLVVSGQMENPNETEDCFAENNSSQRHALFMSLRGAQGDSHCATWQSQLILRLSLRVLQKQQNSTARIEKLVGNK